MPGHVTVVAVDLGASSGRVMLGRLGGGPGAGVELEEVYRFASEPVTLWENGRPALHWDAAGLFTQILAGLRAAREGLRPGEQIDSIGIDSWAVDYGLLDADGALLGTPYCYRDGVRGLRGVERVHALLGPAELYALNGLQHLPFNTVFQLAAEQGDARWEVARTMLLLPDLVAYWLTGEIGAEVTNASTTGLLNVRSRQWDLDLADRLGIPSSLLPPLRRPGERIGSLLPHVAEATGLPTSTAITAVGSHDTASAVVGVPASGEGFAYVACGTWSLVGLELDQPVLSQESRAANFTNELGVDGTVRYLRNVMGLWLLDQSLHTWSRGGTPANRGRLLAAAAEEPDGGPVIDPDASRFLPPGDMPARIEQACLDTGQPVPTGRPALVRCILDSLAAAYARAVADAQRLCGHSVDVLHIVGGGSRNRLLCRLTARATGLPVLAGPVEATALGNVLVQARTLGVTGPHLAQLRDQLDRRALERHLPDDALTDDALTDDAPIVGPPATPTA
jgi:rhamnulokinase